MIDYDGRRFSPVTATPGDNPVAQYHQTEDLIWGEFCGGDVRRGSLAGTIAATGELRFAYGMVLDNGTTVAGICRSNPQVLTDGRIRLTEHWERFGAEAASGVSILEELEEGTPPAVQRR